MKKTKIANTKTKTIILITVVLVLCTIIGFSIGKYLFELTHPNIDLLVK